MNYFQIKPSKATRKLIFISITVLFILFCLEACKSTVNTGNVYHEATAQQMPGDTTVENSNNTDADVYHEATDQQMPGDATADSSNNTDANVYHEARVQQTPSEFNIFSNESTNNSQRCPSCPPCEELDITFCQEREDCATMNASPYNRERNCIEDFEPVACIGIGPYQQPCGDMPTLSEDPNGVCWLFSSNCVPPGWTMETHYDSNPYNDENNEFCTSLFRDAKLCSTNQ